MRARHAGIAVLLTAIVLATAPATVAAQAAKAEKPVELTGKWLFSVTSSAGTGTPTVTLKVQGDSLTGHYSSQTLGELELRGTVSGRTFTFTMHAEIQGTALTVTYRGALEGSDSVKGSVEFGDLGSGTFTGKRQ